jgi:DNA-directed RNA polymerase subunit RPC12/RpoP
MKPLEWLRSIYRRVTRVEYPPVAASFHCSACGRLSSTDKVDAEGRCYRCRPHDHECSRCGAAWHHVPGAFPCRTHHRAPCGGCAGAEFPEAHP